MKVLVNVSVFIDQIDAGWWHGKRRFRGVLMKEIVLAGAPIKKQNDFLPIVERLEKHQKRSQRVKLHTRLKRPIQAFLDGGREIAIGVFGYVSEDDVGAQVNQRIQIVVW